jgi:hypothetical protein
MSYIYIHTYLYMAICITENMAYTNIYLCQYTYISIYRQFSIFEVKECGKYECHILGGSAIGIIWRGTYVYILTYLFLYTYIYIHISIHIYVSVCFSVSILFTSHQFAFIYIYFNIHILLCIHRDFPINWTLNTYNTYICFSFLSYLLPTNLPVFTCTYAYTSIYIHVLQYKFILLYILRDSPINWILRHLGQNQRYIYMSIYMYIYVYVYIYIYIYMY